MNTVIPTVVPMSLELMLSGFLMYITSVSPEANGMSLEAVLKLPVVPETYSKPVDGKLLAYEELGANREPLTEEPSLK